MPGQPSLPTLTPRLQRPRCEQRRSPRIGNVTKAAPSTPTSRSLVVASLRAPPWPRRLTGAPSHSSP